MSGRLHSLAATRTKPTRGDRVPHRAMFKVLIVGLAFTCLPSFFCTVARAQDQTISVGVLEFQDERTEQRASVAPEIARKLSQKLNGAYKDVLARQFNRIKDASSIRAMTVDQLGALGKQQGVQFVIRGGLLPSSEGETKSAIQLYAVIVSVETLSTKSIRVTADSAALDQALSSAIEQLSKSIHQAIVSPVSEATASEESPQDTTGETNQPGDSAGLPESRGLTESTGSAEADASETDEELQQLIAQAESLVADGSSVSGERLSSLSKALENLKVALEAKATLLEEGNDATSADQEIAKQKDILQNSLSSLVESEMPGAVDAPDEQDEQPSGERKNLLTRIDGYAGAALSIIQKIQEIRAAFRGATGNSEPIESTQEAPLSEEEASLPTEESTEEVSGVITDVGEPVAGVTVTEPESGASAETDNNGSYSLKGVPAGRLAKLVLTKNGKQLALGQIDVTRGRESIADFELKEQTAGARKPALRILPSTVRLTRAKTGDGNVGVLKGVVKDAQGRLAGRALVRVGRAMARTDSQGRYAFLNVPPGVHKIIVQRNGSKPRAEMVQVAARKSSESKIQFGPADKIANVRTRQTMIVRGTGNVLRGVVFDFQKRPLPAAKITIVQQTSAMSVLAGPRGNYFVRDLRPGTYRVLVSKAGYVPSAQAVNVSAGEMPQRDFQLRKTDSPFVERALARRRTNQSRVAGNSNKTGQRVNREDRPRPQAANTTNATNATNATMPFQVDASVGRLKGRVTDSRTGKPVSGATISILGRRRATTNEEGTYSVNDSPSGSFQIAVSHAGFAKQERSVKVLAGNSTHENFVLVAENAVERIEAKRIELSRPPFPARGAEIAKGELSGRIVEAKSGRPVAGVIVSVAGQRTVTSDRDGSYAFKDLTPGAYRVIARKSEFLDVIVSLTVRAGETTKANLRLNTKPLNRVQ